MASDKDGISYFGNARICNILKIDDKEYEKVRDNLIKKSLISFNGSLYQVLSLPEETKTNSEAENSIIKREAEFSNENGANIKRICKEVLAKLK